MLPYNLSSRQQVLERLLALPQRHFRKPAFATSFLDL